jgi:hypothetical protein
VRSQVQILSGPPSFFCMAQGSCQCPRGARTIFETNMRAIKITATVWTGMKSVKVRGKLLDVPRVSVYDDSVSNYGLAPENVTRTFQTITLFRSDKPVNSISRCGNHSLMWWIYYTPNRLTGGFETKREAVAWRHNGGR